MRAAGWGWAITLRSGGAAHTLRATGGHPSGMLRFCQAEGSTFSTSNARVHPVPCAQTNRPSSNPRSSWWPCLPQAAVHAVGDLAYRAMHSVAPEAEEGEGEGGGTANARELAAPARVEEEGREETGVWVGLPPVTVADAAVMNWVVNEE